MKRIKLTKNQYALVSDNWFDYLNQWNWGAWWNEQTQSYYARRGTKIDSKNVTILMSRVVGKTPKGMIADHINHNTLDNQDDNIRNVTPTQSNMNRIIKKNTLGEHHIRRMGRKFQVRISLQGKYVLDKSFYNLSDAISIRDKTIKEYYNEFAYSGYIGD